MAPPGGDQEVQGEESRSASGWPGSPEDQSHDLPRAAKQSRGGAGGVSRAGGGSPGPTRPDNSTSSGGYLAISWAP